MTKLHVRKGDKVLVIAGKDKGKEGVVLKALPQKERVVVEGCGVVKKALRPTQQNPQGGIIHKEAPIHVSNVQIVCPKCGKATRVTNKRNDEGKRVRVCKKCGADID
ncbi:50S ribosomal protein L24 [Slackia heliotrinireducens]|jgi:large subunit ribosomal protein L24|uniref:Large ribosomal subunit protein uL24 n=1 Tax=Slackia heliotrinireducens (strain ATCC 29202 / DSM 20476 / NCTC 11029 / RHS 1) TaxID=471855 RepID=C7N1Q4_SLAHD|nr:LSU ribosomal protein L24P [Slackia heliotrinireducens DSM 20476]VEH02579.1 HPB12 [Slackia heliotrinireducens]